jgi:hypothetical protein
MRSMVLAVAITSSLALTLGATRPRDAGNVVRADSQSASPSERGKPDAVARDADALVD